jgi:hypothetical protein
MGDRVFLLPDLHGSFGLRVFSESLLCLSASIRLSSLSISLSALNSLSVFGMCSGEKNIEEEMNNRKKEKNKRKKREMDVVQVWGN